MPPAQAILNDSHTPNSPTLHTSYSCWQCRPTPLGLRAGQAAARGPGGQTPRAHQRRLSSPVGRHGQGLLSVRYDARSRGLAASAALWHVVCSRVSGKQLGSYREGVLFIRAPKQHVFCLQEAAAKAPYKCL
eukprot:1152178-Pelagomonas_calceolata.AAC.1